ncbi:hypothetical protein ACQ33O_08470 [Ferruginibacter sp. SUN002]|uniref:hypothetical protein n=1 Tax=Ferruginibacter sp. SUN002 TaxID=2937789 RepID=UPI003D3614C2
MGTKMRYTIIIAIFSFVFIACSKDKFTTKPQLTFKSANTNVVEKENVLEFTLDFTDEEGDIDSLFMFKITKNCSLSDLKDSSEITASLPRVKKQRGDLIVTYKNAVNAFPYLPCYPLCTENDTCYFRFVLMDKAKNKSDTLNTGQIVIIK